MLNKLRYCLFAATMASMLVCLAAMPYNGWISFYAFCSFLVLAMITDAVDVSVTNDASSW